MKLMSPQRAAVRPDGRANLISPGGRSNYLILPAGRPAARWLIGFLLSAFCFPLFGAVQITTATLTVTNTAGATNGHWFRIFQGSDATGYLYTFTNRSPVGFHYISTTNAAGYSAATTLTNTYRKLTNDWTSKNLRIRYASSTSLTIQSDGALALTLTIGTNWGTLAIVTNSTVGLGTFSTSNLVASAISLSGETIEAWSDLGAASIPDNSITTNKMDANAYAVFTAGGGSGVTNNQVLTGIPTSTNANLIGTFTGNAAGLTNLPTFTNANALYVDLNGSDTNPGTQERPFKTIQAAKAASGYGTWIMVGAGSNFVTTSVLSPPGGGISGLGPDSHIWSSNSLALHGPTLVPTDNSYIGNLSFHSDAPVGSYQDISVGTPPGGATNWLIENFVVYGRPSTYNNIDGVVFSTSVTNQGVIRNFKIFGGYDAFSFRGDEFVGPGFVNLLIQNGAIDLHNDAGRVTAVRAFTFGNLKSNSVVQVQDVSVTVTNGNFTADSHIINTELNIEAGMTVSLDNVRFVNRAGSNDITLRDNIRLFLSGGNLPDGRVYNAAGATIQYSARRGDSLTNIPSAAIADPTGSGAVVKSNAPAIRDLTVTADTASLTLEALTVNGNQITSGAVTPSTNYLGGGGALLIERVGVDEKSTRDLDEFDGGIITRWTGGGARKFEILTPNFYANGVNLTNILSAAIIDPTGSGFVVKSNAPVIRSLTLTPDNSLTRTALAQTGNTVYSADTTNYHGGVGSTLLSRTTTGNIFSFDDLDEFDGGIITRWTGAAARRFEILTPNFYANGVNLTNLNASSLASGTVSEQRLHYAGTDPAAGLVLTSTSSNTPAWLAPTVGGFDPTISNSYNGTFTGTVIATNASLQTIGAIDPDALLQIQTGDGGIFIGTSGDLETDCNSLLLSADGDITIRTLSAGSSLTLQDVNVQLTGDGEYRGNGAGLTNLNLNGYNPIFSGLTVTGATPGLILVTNPASASYVKIGTNDSIFGTNGGLAGMSYTLTNGGARFSSNVVAAKFFGDGSALTGISGGGANYYSGDYYLGEFMENATPFGRYVFTANSGSILPVTTPLDTTHFGVVQLSTSSSATAAPVLTTAQPGAFLPGSGYTITNSWWLRLEDLSTGAENYQLRAGFSDSTTSAEPTDAVMFRYSSDTNSGNWQLVTRAVGAESVSNTVSAVSADTWYKLTVEVNSTSTLASFYVNDTLVGTLASNIPDVDSSVNRCFGSVLQMVKAVGTTARICYVDAVTYAVNGPARTP